MLLFAFVTRCRKQTWKPQQTCAHTQSQIVLEICHRCFLEQNTSHTGAICYPMSYTDVNTQANLHTHAATSWWGAGDFAVRRQQSAPPLGGDVWDGNILSIYLQSIYVCQYMVHNCQYMSLRHTSFYSPTGPAHSAGGFKPLNFGHPFSPLFRLKFWINFRRRFWFKNGSLLEPKIRPNVPKWWSINVSPQRCVKKSVCGRFSSDFWSLQYT